MIDQIRPRRQSLPDGLKSRDSCDPLSRQSAHEHGITGLKDAAADCSFRNSLAGVAIKVPNLAGSTSEFKIGDLISSIINFIVIALVVFVAYKQLSRYGIVEDKTKGEKK